MKRYLDLVKKVLEQGVDSQDRTGVGSRSLFGAQLRFDLQHSFPLVTTKKIHFKSVVHELLWMLRGHTNVKYLNDHGVNIWNPWADDSGDLGRIYGAQWREWHTADGQVVDQISQTIKNLKNNPHSRRHVVVAYNPGELDKMALPPCHAFFQFYLRDQKLSCQMYQRSADIFLGVPFNIASYSLLTMMIAQDLGCQAHEFVHTFGDVHLYHNHFDQAKKQLKRTPFPPPQIQLASNISTLNFKYEDITLMNYQHHSAIPAPIAV